MAVEIPIAAIRLESHVDGVNVFARDAQFRAKRKDRGQQAATDNEHALAGAMQRIDSLACTGHHFFDVTLTEPCQSRAVRPNDREPFRIDIIKWDAAVHRCRCEWRNFIVGPYAAREFIDALKAAQCAIAIEAHRIEFRSMIDHSSNSTA